MGMKKMLESFNHAINGIVDAARTQRNMKILENTPNKLITCPAS